MVNKATIRNCGTKEKDQGTGSVTKGMEMIPREPVDKKHFQIIPYSHGKGLIKLTTWCNTSSHPLRASGLGITQALGEHKSRRKE